MNEADTCRNYDFPEWEHSFCLCWIGRSRENCEKT